MEQPQPKAKRKMLFQQEVCIETKPHDRGKGAIWGNLFFYEEDGIVMMEWQPDIRGDTGAMAKSYAVKYRVDEVSTFSLKGQFRLFITLKTETALLPFYSDVGFPGLSKFLTKYLAQKKEREARLSPPTQAQGLLEESSNQGLFNPWLARQKLFETTTRADGHLPTQELKCRVRQKFGELGTFDVISSERANSMPNDYHRWAPVTAEQWHAWQDSTGAIVNEAALREAIFHGGASDEIRREVWCYFLKHRGDAAFHEQRKELYAVMKRQWQSLTKEQLERSSVLRDRANRVFKDVERTDRDMAFFAGQSPNLVKLNDILMTYSQYNFDLGYVQGMSDFVAVLLVLMEDEVDAFWCFVGLMDRMEDNFKMDQLRMVEQLQHLGLLERFLDPDLLEHFEKNSSGDLYCCFRWLLILFKREFPFPSLYAVWEALFTDWLSKDYQLFLSCGVLWLYRDELLQQSFEGIVKFINELSNSLDANDVLAAAYGLRLRFISLHDIPDELRYLSETWLQRNQPAAALPAAANAASTAPVPVATSHGPPGVHLASIMLDDSAASDDVDSGWTEIN